MNSKEAFTEELCNLHVRKKSRIPIEETPNKEAVTVDELQGTSSLHISKENQ